MTLVGLATSARLPPRSDCPRGTLPAYSHNDYLNTHPLSDALALGYRGAEADVFLVKGELQLRLVNSTSVGSIEREARRIGYVKPGERLFVVKGIPAWRKARTSRRGDRP